MDTPSTPEAKTTGSSIEEMQFHWNKWKDESKAFWGRAILGTALLLTSIMFQFWYYSNQDPWHRT